MTIWSKKDIKEYRVEEGTQPSSYSYYNPYMSVLERPISYRGNVVEINNLSYGGMYIYVFEMEVRRSRKEECE